MEVSLDIPTYVDFGPGIFALKIGLILVMMLVMYWLAMKYLLVHELSSNAEAYWERKNKNSASFVLITMVAIAVLLIGVFWTSYSSSMDCKERSLAIGREVAAHYNLSLSEQQLRDIGRSAYGDLPVYEIEAKKKIIPIGEAKIRDADGNMTQKTIGVTAQKSGDDRVLVRLYRGTLTKDGQLENRFELDAN